MSNQGSGLTGAAAAQEALKRRQKTGLPGKANYQTKNPGDINFYTDEAPGLKVTPKTVLITSLVYLGIVVVLHLLGKIRSSDPAAAGADK